VISNLAGARVLVTGGSGLIGRPTVALLAQSGARVRRFDLVPSQAGPEHDIVDIVGDLRDPDAVAAAVEGMDAVVHLGGIPGPELEGEVTTYAVNAVGTLEVFAASAAAGVRKVVYASSINATGLPIGKLRPPSQLPYGEDEPASIGDTYSLSKEANERAALMAAARWGLELTGLRFPLVRDIRADGGAAFAAHIRAALRDDPVRQAYEGWSYLDAGDAARAVVAALTHSTPAAPGILVAAPMTYLAEDTRDAAAAVVPDVPVGALFGREVGLDLTRAESLLGFHAEFLLERLSVDLLATTIGAPV
jgi:nucleoside-diphosphate-sugar epimerase